MPHLHAFICARGVGRGGILAAVHSIDIRFGAVRAFTRLTTEPLQEEFLDNVEARFGFRLDIEQQRWHS